MPYAPVHDLDVPWGDEPRWMEKSLIFKTTVLHRDRTDIGVPFHAILDEVFGDEWATGGPRYGRAYRFIQQYGDFFEMATLYGDLLWVAPSEQADPLIRRIQELGTQESAGVAGYEDEPPANPLPRERAAMVLRSVSRIRTDRQRALLLHLLAEEKERMLDAEGNRKTLDLDGGRGAVQAATRFTHLGRASRVQAQFETAADALSTSYDVASWVTYTLPRECIDSVYDSVGVIRDALTRLHRDRFTYDAVSRPRPGYVPDYLSVLETHDDLVAHLHVVYGGEERVMARSDLRADWADLLDAPPSKPPQVDVRTLSLGAEAWTVTAVDGEPERHDGDIRNHHRDGLRDLAALASMPPRALHGLADDLANGLGKEQEEGRRLAGLALPFATEARFTTTARSLSTA